MKYIAALLALIAVAAPAIARADLWINIKAPYTVKDVGDLPRLGCELMHHDAQREVVRCSNWVPKNDWSAMAYANGTIGSMPRAIVMNYPSKADTQGTKTPCRVGFNYTGTHLNRWDAYTQPPCKQYWQNNNTLDIF